MQSATIMLKQLTTPPFIAFSYFESFFRVGICASKKAIRALQSQKNSDRYFRPIYYAGRSLNKMEEKYSKSERETLNLVLALKKFRAYVFASKLFEVVADHQALQYAFKKKGV